ncbi:MAG TPA: hydrogenase expression/formation protein HypE [Solirubrobacteraceae bacterium]|jgi:hydrogenase expression/formation protein HypE
MDVWRIESSREALIIPSAMTGQTIQLDHGSPRGCSQELLAELIAPALGAADGGAGEASLLELDGALIAMSSDAFVLDPLFFGNGDIGRLAVCATVNDLAVNGAVPRYLTLSLVIEQGLAVADLERVLDSVRVAALEAEVEVVAGDTRVVPSGAADRLFINATGVGELERDLDLGVAHVRPGDAVIVTGALGEHGLHVLALREGLDCAGRVLSDCAPLSGLIWNLLEDYGSEIHCMRTLVRGGLGVTLNELADHAGVSIEVEEHHLPVARETRAAAERLAVDPLYLPSAGSICVLVERAAAAEVLELLRWQPQGQAAQILGIVRERRGSAVTVLRPDGGGESVLAPRSGAPLPRLC